VTFKELVRIMVDADLEAAGIAPVKAGEGLAERVQPASVPLRARSELAG